jgi:hypothetical protein
MLVARASRKEAVMRVRGLLAVIMFAVVLLVAPAAAQQDGLYPPVEETRGEVVTPAALPPAATQVVPSADLARTGQDVLVTGGAALVLLLAGATAVLWAWRMRRAIACRADTDGRGSAP